MPKITDPWKKQLSIATQEANRLNRLYKEDYKQYKNALFPSQKLQEKTLQNQQKLAQEIAKKDKKNATIDELTNLARHTYIYGTNEKAILKKHIAIKAKRIVSTLPKITVPLMTSEFVQSRLEYDPEEGTFIWNDGRNEGKPAGVVQRTTKAPRTQNMQRLPIKPRNYKPSVSGYNISSEQAYKNHMQNPQDYPTPVYARYYLIRTPKTELYATRRITYYITPIKPTLVITLQGNKYPANQIAYLYMEAGGDWDYTQGLDKIHRINTTTAPQGLHYYDPRTNKRARIPCRDGDKLNFKWCNIKPDIITTAQIIKDPTKPAAKLKRTRVYSPHKYIQRGALGWVTNFKSKSIPLHYALTKDEALNYFYEVLSKVQGKKINKANGDVWVVRT